jgi:hypothetical protein
METWRYHVETDEESWSFALDQSAFGPRRLLVAFADGTGRFRSLAHAPRTDPPEPALGPCIEHVGRGAAAAVAFCDEPVVHGPPPSNLATRLARARSITASHGIHLVGWFACHDLSLRSSRLALQPDAEWWDVPGDGDPSPRHQRVSRRPGGHAGGGA